MSPSFPGAVTGAPRVWLRLEGLAVLALAVFFYARGGHSWMLLALLFLAPDLSFAAYLVGARAGAVGYNLAHSYLGPALACALAVATGRPPVVALMPPLPAPAPRSGERAAGRAPAAPAGCAAWARPTHAPMSRAARRRRPAR